MIVGINCVTCPRIPSALLLLSAILPSHSQPKSLIEMSTHTQKDANTPILSDIRDELRSLRHELTQVKSNAPAQQQQSLLQKIEVQRAIE